jgi:hypothetical protein
VGGTPGLRLSRLTGYRLCHSLGLATKFVEVGSPNENVPPADAGRSGRLEGRTAGPLQHGVVIAFGANAEGSPGMTFVIGDGCGRHRNW